MIDGKDPCKDCQKTPSRVLRMGRAHYACLACGRDLTLDLMLVNKSSNGTALTAVEVVMPSDFMPALELRA